MTCESLDLNGRRCICLPLVRTSVQNHNGKSRIRSLRQVKCPKVYPWKVNSSAFSMVHGKRWGIFMFFLRVPFGLASPPRHLAVPAESTSPWTETLISGSFRHGFPTYAEALTFLEDSLTVYPHNLQKTVVGKSFEGRPLVVFILTRSNSSTHSFPQSLITALHHAREPASVTVVLYFIRRLLEAAEEGYPLAQYLLHRREVIIVPFINPDGYVAIEMSHDWDIRKNRRPTCTNSLRGGRLKERMQGVDLNRNYDFSFKNEHNGCDSEEYEGEKPFSEPETQAIRTLVETHNFTTALNFHAYGGIWTHPFNCCNNSELPLDVKQFFDELQSTLFVSYFERAPRVPILGYATYGEADDWMFGRHGILSMSPEVGAEEDGFYPPREKILQIARDNFPRILEVLLKSGVELSVRLQKDTTEANRFIFEIFNSGLSSSGPGIITFVDAPEIDAVASSWMIEQEDQVGLFAKGDRDGRQPFLSSVLFTHPVGKSTGGTDFQLHHLVEQGEEQLLPVYSPNSTHHFVNITSIPSNTSTLASMNAFFLPSFSSRSSQSFRILSSSLSYRSFIYLCLVLPEGLDLPHSKEIFCHCNVIPKALPETITAPLGIFSSASPHSFCSVVSHLVKDVKIPSSMLMIAEGVKKDVQTSTKSIKRLTFALVLFEGFGVVVASLFCLVVLKDCLPAAEDEPFDQSAIRTHLMNFGRRFGARVRFLCCWLQMFPFFRRRNGPPIVVVRSEAGAGRHPHVNEENEPLTVEMTSALQTSSLPSGGGGMIQVVGKVLPIAASPLSAISPAASSVEETEGDRFIR